MAVMASVVGTCIAVVAIDCGIDTLTVGARINGTFIMVVALVRLKIALAMLTLVNGTHVIIITIRCVHTRLCGSLKYNKKTEENKEVAGFHGSRFWFVRKLNYLSL
jgi:hypothetical protein